MYDVVAVKTGRLHRCVERSITGPVKGVRAHPVVLS